MKAGGLAAMAALTGAALFWGLAPVANRYLVSGQLSPWHLLVLRLLIASLLFAPLLARLRRQSWAPSELGRLALAGLVAVFGYYVPTTLGALWIPAGTAGLLINSEPVFIVLLSLLALRQRQPARVLVGLGLATAGELVLVGWTPGGGSYPHFALGAALTLGGACLWAVYSLLLAPLSQRHGALASTALTTAFGSLPLLPLLRGDLLRATAGLSPLAWGGLLLLAVGATALGTLFWSFGLARIPPAQAGVFLYLQPLISLLGGALLLGEAVGNATLLAGALIVGGVALAQAG